MKLSESAITNSVRTTMIMAFMAIVGILCLRNLGVDLFPRVEFPVVTIISVLPGSDPHTIETMVTKPVEDVVSTLSSIKHIRSSSADSISQVVVEFNLEKNVDVAFQEIQAKLRTIRASLPSDLEEPIVEKFDIDSSPIMAVLVSGNKPIQEISFIADNVVKNRLQQIPGVGQIKLVGNQARNIWIHIHPDKLEGFMISIQEVISALKSNHIDLPGGRIESGATETIVKTCAEVPTVDEFKNIVITYRNGAPIRLDDIARVEDGLEEQRSLAKLNDQVAVALLVRRQSGTNTIDVAAAVKKEIKSISDVLKGEEVHVRITQDMSLYIARSVGEIWTHLLLGGVLAVLIVYIFLQNVQITIISAFAIPLSLLATCIFMDALHFTMNTLTMLALSLSIGILIDDAIVVSENIFRHFSQSGDPIAAAKIGVNQIGPAAIAITLSVVAVFLPVAFMKGIIGRFMYQFGMTVSIAVLMSLFVSLTLTPMLSAKWLKVSTKKQKRFFGDLHARFFKAIDTVYIAILSRALSHKTMTIALAFSILGITAICACYINSEFLPIEDQSEFNIKVKAPVGSSLATTEKYLASIKQLLSDQPWIEYTFSTIGTDFLAKVSEGTIYVKMGEKHTRNLSQFQAMQIVREQIFNAHLPCRTSVEIVPRVVAGGKKACSLQVDLQGNNLDTLHGLAENLSESLKGKSGYVDIDLSSERDNPEFEVYIHKDYAASLHVTGAAIAQTIRALVGGLDVSKFSSDGHRYNVSMRCDKKFRSQMESIYNLPVKNLFGDMIPLGNLVTIRKETAPMQIDRNNKERVVSVYINLQNGIKSLSEGIKDIHEIMAKNSLPSGYSYEFTGHAEVMKESFLHLFTALFLAVLVIYMVLASQFESFIHPLTIMLSLPFAFCGAIFALFLYSATLNINTIIGIIMLMGLVTKNAILLVDYTNTLITDEGMPVRKALFEAGKIRLKPILMTTLAMIFGMLPVALSHADGSEARSPMAIATIGGLISSMFLTLILVPVAYEVVEKLRNRFSFKEDC